MHPARARVIRWERLLGCGRCRAGVLNIDMQDDMYRIHNCEDVLPVGLWRNIKRRNYRWGDEGFDVIPTPMRFWTRCSSGNWQQSRGVNGARVGCGATRLANTSLTKGKQAKTPRRDVPVTDTSRTLYVSIEGLCALISTEKWVTGVMWRLERLMI